MGEPVFRFHFANFLRFMHTKESKTCVLSLAKPLYCVNRNPCFTLASAKPASTASDNILLNIRSNMSLFAKRLM